MKKLIKNLLFLAGFLPIVSIGGLLYSELFSKVFLFIFLVVCAGVVSFVGYFSLKEYRLFLQDKISIIFSNTLVRLLTFFVGISVISTVFAFDRYVSFWGTIERGDGLTSIFALFLFCILTLVHFEKEEWITFFKITIITSVVLVGKASWDFFIGGVDRPGSFVGNPAFFAGYLLFSITSAGIVLKEYWATNGWWKMTSVLVIVSALFGIFLSETRSAILGFVVGFISVIFYVLFRGEEYKIGNFYVKNLAKKALLLLCGFMLFFLLTINSVFWQKVPGFSRVVEINFNSDQTTASRLLIWESAINSISPKIQTKEFFIGWGMENITFALGKFYNPEIYKYDSGFFDRSHNKFLDVLITTGILGTLIYLSIWFSVFRFLFKREKFSWVFAFLLFFASSFFVHLIFVFDQFPTSLCLFFLFAFIVFLKQEEVKKSVLFTKKNTYFILSGILLILTFAFLRGYLPAFFQMQKYASGIEKINISTIKKIEQVFKFNSPAQREIRYHMLNIVSELEKDVEKDKLKVATYKELLDFAVSKGEDYISRNEKDFRFFTPLAGVYTIRYELTKNISDLEKSELFMRRALKFAPNRPELTNNLVFNLMNQGRIDEAISVADENIARDPNLGISYYFKATVLFSKGQRYFIDSFSNFEKAFNLEQTYFLSSRTKNTRIYGDFLEYFYNTKNKDLFIRVAQRLIENEYPLSEELQKLIEYVEKGSWPRVEFK